MKKYRSREWSSFPPRVASNKSALTTSPTATNGPKRAWGMAAPILDIFLNSNYHSALVFICNSYRNSRPGRTPIDQNVITRALVGQRLYFTDGSLDRGVRQRALVTVAAAEINAQATKQIGKLT